MSSTDSTYSDIHGNQDSWDVLSSGTDFSPLANSSIDEPEWSLPLTPPEPSNELPIHFDQEMADTDTFVSPTAASAPPAETWFGDGNSPSPSPDSLAGGLGQLCLGSHPTNEDSPSVVAEATSADSPPAGTPPPVNDFPYEVVQEVPAPHQDVTAMLLAIPPMSKNELISQCICALETIYKAHHPYVPTRRSHGQSVDLEVRCDTVTWTFKIRFTQTASDLFKVTDVLKMSQSAPNTKRKKKISRSDVDKEIRTALTKSRLAGGRPKDVYEKLKQEYGSLLGATNKDRTKALRNIDNSVRRMLQRKRKRVPASPQMKRSSRATRSRL